jgi:hypothetical protein
VLGPRLLSSPSAVAFYGSRRRNYVPIFCVGKEPLLLT